MRLRGWGVASPSARYCPNSQSASPSPRATPHRRRREQVRNGPFNGAPARKVRSLARDLTADLAPDNRAGKSPGWNARAPTRPMHCLRRAAAVPTPSVTSRRRSSAARPLPSCSPSTIRLPRSSRLTTCAHSASAAASATAVWRSPRTCPWLASRTSCWPPLRPTAPSSWWTCPARFALPRAGEAIDTRIKPRRTKLDQESLIQVRSTS